VELPRLEELYKKYKDQGLNVVAVEGRRDTEKAKKFIKEKKLSFTFLENGKDDAEVVRKLFSVRAYPTLYVIDKQNRVMYYHLGFEEGGEKIIEQQVQKLLLSKS
jgi:peroxiredoxin